MKQASRATQLAKLADADAGESKVERAVMSVLSEGELQSPRALDRLAGLAKQLGPGFQVRLFWELAHLRFEPGAAERHWKQLWELHGALSRKLGAPVDVRVALVQYFLGISRKLKSPTIIELKLFRATQASAYRDDLTGLYNYRYLREHLAREIARVERYDSSTSVILFDIDNFKAYNDTFGHGSGNRLLARVARILATSTRKADVVARYGGEEFVIVLSGYSKDRALLVAERLCRAIAGKSGRGGQKPVTVSGGVATHPIDGMSGEELIAAADQAMYVAKSQGKNRVALHDGDRRSHERLQLAATGSYRACTSSLLPFQGLDLSESGMLAKIDEPLPVDSLLDLKLRLPSSPHGLPVVGRVVRSRALHRGYEVGIRFVSMPDATRRHLLGKLRGRRRPTVPRRVR